MNTKRQQGFSLIELLIVVAIIGIIAAIAIPNLLASKRAANEGSATATLRTLTGAQAVYSNSRNGRYGTLVQLAGDNLVDTVIGFNPMPAAGNLKSGYNFIAIPLPAADGACTAAVPCSFTTTATPASVGTVTATGTRKFYSETTGVITAQHATDVVPMTVASVSLPIGN